jgi:hypothetical protein
MTSATEIRGAWPQLNEKRKTALVMSLYPKTQTNPKLAATVVKLLDTALGVVDESALDNLPRPNKRDQFKSLHRQRKQRGLDEQGVEKDLNEFSPRGDDDGKDEKTYLLQLAEDLSEAMYGSNKSKQAIENIIAKIRAVGGDVKVTWNADRTFNVAMYHPMYFKQGYLIRLVGQGDQDVAENTAPNPRVDLTPNYPNYATLVGEFIGVKKNRVWFRIVSAELKPGQGETEKIFRAMSTNTPIGVEISRVKNRAVLEALKPDAFAALQQAKQRIEQNRQQEVDQWAQEFRANSAKLAGQQLKRAVSPPPVPVAQPGEKHAVLQNRISQLDQAINKQQHLDALTQKLERKGLLTPAMQMDFDTRMYVRDAAADDYQALNQKLDRAIVLATNRLRTNKLAFKEDPDYIEEGRKI